ncbi:hypothetical protein CN895_24090 [Bacillus cereus]|uniref:hypothetical protein n=1 Tax=Bacillus cereus TaxID=1396 RepID=UPI000BF9DF26|nr:hypothetical protein [Bacillus cereus]PEY43146.1 hypothetical protein CN336_15105 [Bacillus cereus]PGK09694.1 hypothetical protein CN895_24090 [Bacillus cereus]
MKNINKYSPYFVLISVVILDLIIFYAVMDALKVLQKELIVGIITFLGSILGGVITLAGVKATLKHRDREVFLLSATEKLLAVERLIEYLKGPFNDIFYYQNGPLDLELKCMHIKREAASFDKELNANKEMIYKNLEYDKVHLITFYQKTLSSIIRKTEINEEEKDACIEKIQSIFGLLLESKNELESKYYKYKKEHSN